jgi:hypothetical protein
MDFADAIMKDRADLRAYEAWQLGAQDTEPATSLAMSKSLIAVQREMRLQAGTTAIVVSVAKAYAGGRIAADTGRIVAAFAPAYSRAFAAHVATLQATFEDIGFAWQAVDIRLQFAIQVLLAFEAGSRVDAEATADAWQRLAQATLHRHANLTAALGRCNLGLACKVLLVPGWAERRSRKRRGVRLPVRLFDGTMEYDATIVDVSRFGSRRLSARGTDRSRRHCTLHNGPGAPWGHVSSVSVVRPIWPSADVGCVQRRINTPEGVVAASTNTAAHHNEIKQRQQNCCDDAGKKKQKQSCSPRSVAIKATSFRQVGFQTAHISENRCSGLFSRQQRIRLFERFDELHPDAGVMRPLDDGCDRTPAGKLHLQLVATAGRALH